MRIPALASMSIDALLAARDAIDKAIKERAAGMRRQLQALGVLEGQSQSKRRSPKRQAQKRHALKGRPAPVKYRGPKGETWAGRGLQPRWLKEELAKGRSLDEFANAEGAPPGKKAAPSGQAGSRRAGSGRKRQRDCHRVSVMFDRARGAEG